MQEGLGKAACAGQGCLSTPSPAEISLVLATMGHSRRQIDYDGNLCSHRARVPFSAHVLCRVSRPRNGKTAHCWPGAYRTR